jgi:hypothetical protein
MDSERFDASVYKKISQGATTEMYLLKSSSRGIVPISTVEGREGVVGSTCHASIC